MFSYSSNLDLDDKQNCSLLHKLDWNQLRLENVRTNK